MKAYLCLFFALTIVSFGMFCKAANISESLETVRLTNMLNAQQQVSVDRYEAKQEVVEELIAGRATLTEAADKFGELNTLSPESLTAVRITYPGDTEKESLCREVLQRVKNTLEERTSEAEKVLPRLEKEMQECIADSQ